MVACCSPSWIPQGSRCCSPGDGGGAAGRHRCVYEDGERQTTRAVDVWRAAPDLPVFGVHVSIDGASWTCGAVRGWDVDGLADGLEALLA